MSLALSIKLMSSFIASTDLLEGPLRRMGEPWMMREDLEVTKRLSATTRSPSRPSTTPALRRGGSTSSPRIRSPRLALICYMFYYLHCVSFLFAFFPGFLAVVPVLLLLLFRVLFVLFH